MTNPYNDICIPIEEWCLKNYYTDFLVTIQLDDRETTEYLEFNAMTLGFIWKNDWWEGEKEVKLLGFIPIDAIKIHNYPDRLPSKYDAVNIV